MTNKSSSKQSATQTAKPKASTKEKEKTTMPKFTSNDSMLTFKGYGIINPLACNEAEVKLLTKTANAIIDNPITLSGFRNVFDRQVGYNFTVPLSSLINSWENEEFTQYKISPRNVLNLLVSPSDGLVVGNKLNRHIEVAFQEDNINPDGSIIDKTKLIIGGGRNRLCAVLTWLVLSQLFLEGYSPVELINGTVPVEKLAQLASEVLSREDVQNLEVPAQPVVYSLQYVIHSNESRTMDASEKGFISIQSKGIDVSLMDIAKAIQTKKLGASKGWSAMFALLADRDDVGLTVLAANSLGGKIYTMLNRNKYVFPKTSDNLVKLVQALWERMPSEISQLKEKNITNIARDGIGALQANLGSYAMTNDLWDVHGENAAIIEAQIKTKQAKLEEELKKAQAGNVTTARKGRKRSSASPDPDVTTQEYVNPPVEAVAEEELVTA